MCGELDDDNTARKLEEHLYDAFIAHARRLLAESARARPDARPARRSEAARPVAAVL